MKYQVGDIVELDYKYGFKCCNEEYRIVSVASSSVFMVAYNVCLLCSTPHGRHIIDEREVAGHSFDGWVRHVRAEHGLTA